MTHDQRLEAATNRLRTATAVAGPYSWAPDADEYLADYLERYIFDNWCRQAERDAPSQPWYGPQGRWLTVYHVQLAYGGPEEGGWWYDAGERLEYVDVTGRDVHTAEMQLVAKYDHLDDPRGLHSVVSTGVITVIGPSRHPGSEHYPEYRPQYE
jgi:hypothetical protein